jgi:hypothetical protein
VYLDWHEREATEKHGKALILTDMELASIRVFLLVPRFSVFHIILHPRGA